MGMVREIKFIVLTGWAAMLLLAGTAVAQTAAAAAPANQGTSPLLFAGQAPRNNLLSVGLSASGSYDPNGMNTNPAQGALISVFSTPLTFAVDRPGWSANLRYTPQYTYSADLSNYNSMAHIAGGTLSFRVNPRMTVSLHDAYSHTSNPSQSLADSQSAPVFGISSQLNPTGNGEYLTITSEQAGADISYSLSAHSSIGVGGGYQSEQSFQPGNASIYLQDFTSWSGHAFYSRRVSRHQTLGLQFQWQRIDSLGGMSQATPISLQYFHQIQLSRSLTLSLFGGPELTNIDDTVPQSFLVAGVPLGSASGQGGPLVMIRTRQWSGSGGGTLGWSSQHNAVSGSFIRQTSSGGAFGGLSTSSIVGASYIRQLTPHTNLSLSANYTRNDTVDPLNPAPVGSYNSVMARISRVIAPRAELSVAYAYYRSGSVVNGTQPLVSGDHQQVMVSLAYHWERAIGR